MKTIALYLLAFYLLVVLNSCQSDNILHADFESDVVGNPPAFSPAGAPEGDEIEVTRPGIVVVENSEKPGMKALNYNSSAGFLEFRAVATDLHNVLWFYFTAKNRTNTQTLIELKINQKDGVLARMVITNTGQIQLKRTFFGDYTDVIGHINPRISYTIIFAVNVPESKFNVTVTNSGVGRVINVRDKPILYTDPVNSTTLYRPLLMFWFEDTSQNDYVIEDVTISKKRPG